MRAITSNWHRLCVQLLWRIERQMIAVRLTNRPLEFREQLMTLEGAWLWEFVLPFVFAHSYNCFGSHLDFKSCAVQAPGTPGCKKWMATLKYNKQHYSSSWRIILSCPYIPIYNKNSGRLWLHVKDNAWSIIFFHIQLLIFYFQCTDQVSQLRHINWIQEYTTVRIYLCNAFTYYRVCVSPRSENP